MQLFLDLHRYLQLERVNVNPHGNDDFGIRLVHRALFYHYYHFNRLMILNFDVLYPTAWRAVMLKFFIIQNQININFTYMKVVCCH